MGLCFELPVTPPIIRITEEIKTMQSNPNTGLKRQHQMRKKAP